MAKKPPKYVSNARILPSAPGFSGHGNVDLSWFGDKLSDRLIELLIEEMTPVFDKMAEMARNLCPEGTISRSGSGPTKTRVPGTLKKSIKSTVVARTDKTAVLGFLEAGNDDAYYAVMREFGTPRMPVGEGERLQPYFRPAWNKYRADALAAVNKAVERLSSED